MKSGGVSLPCLVLVHTAVAVALNSQATTPCERCCYLNGRLTPSKLKKITLIFSLVFNVTPSIPMHSSITFADI